MCSISKIIVPYFIKCFPYPLFNKGATSFLSCALSRILSKKMNAINYSHGSKNQSQILTDCLSLNQNNPIVGYNGEE